MTFTVCFWTTKKLSLDVFKELGKVTATRNEERGTGTGKMKQTMYVKKMYEKKIQGRERARSEKEYEKKKGIKNLGVISQYLCWKSLIQALTLKGLSIHKN